MLLRALRSWLRALLINRNFTLFLIGTTISATGYWFLLVALGWVVFELTGSTFLLGIMNFAQMAPLFFLGMVGGVLADRFNRRNIMVIGQLVAIASMLMLAVLASLGVLSVPLILAGSFLFGLANSVLWPTWSVFIKDLVGAEHIRQAVATNSARFNLTRVVGPVLAGVTLDRLGASWCLWIAAITSFAAVITIFMMRLPAWQPRPRTGESVLMSLRQGMSFSWKTPDVRRVLTLAGIIGLIAMPFQTFLPALASDVLQAGPEVLGLLTAAIGAGAMAGALASGSRLSTSNPDRTLIVLTLGVALGLALLAVSGTIWLAMLSLAVIGFATIAFLSTANASVQLGVPEELVGRVMGLWVVLNAGTQPLGSLLEGALAERIGLSWTFAVAAALCGLAVFWLLRGYLQQRVSAQTHLTEPR